MSARALLRDLTKRYGSYVDCVRGQDAATKRMKRIAAAVILRLCQRPDGRPLSDCAVARRVGWMLPSEVAAVRAEIEATGVLADELQLTEENRRRQR